MQEIFRFLEALRENNDRDWFHANKEWYLRIKAEHEAFISRVIAALVVVEPEVEGLEAKDCIFRIYRDTRFSPNKQPYKTHIGAYMVSDVQSLLLLQKQVITLSSPAPKVKQNFYI